MNLKAKQNLATPLILFFGVLCLSTSAIFVKLQTHLPLLLHFTVYFLPLLCWRLLQLPANLHGLNVSPCPENSGECAWYLGFS